MVRQTSAQALTNADEIALTVFEPGALLADSLARVISCDFGDSVHGFQAGQIVFFEDNSTRSQCGHGRLEIGDLPAHLSVTTRCFARGFE